jgi:hypothetical protein
MNLSWDTVRVNDWTNEWMYAYQIRAVHSHNYFV